MNDPVLLSRIQFAVTNGFHFLFPPISIGLAWLLVIIEILHWRTDSDKYGKAADFFARLFGITFAVGVATGIVMEFQFGMNWAAYSKYVGDIFGAPLAAEGIFAFFMESVFLGLYLFGRKKMKGGWRSFAVLMVAVGATISAFWIIAANSWQQTPAGFVIQNGRAELVDFWAAVFNASTVYRYSHTVVACLLSGSFFMIGVSALLLLKNGKNIYARAAMGVAIPFGLITALLLVVPTGHSHAQQVARTQAEKFAAMEAVYDTETGCDLVGFGIVKTDPPRLAARVNVPIKGLLSWMAFGDFKAEIRGINSFPADEIPPLRITFYAFHMMVGLGSLFIVVLGLAFWMLKKQTLWESPGALKILFLCSPLPLLANLVGWTVAEVGRQPWVVYKLMRTYQGVSPQLSATEVWISLIAFTLVYTLLLGLYVFLLLHEINKANTSYAEQEAL